MDVPGGRTVTVQAAGVVVPGSVQAVVQSLSRDESIFPARVESMVKLAINTEVPLAELPLADNASLRPPRQLLSAE